MSDPNLFGFGIVVVWIFFYGVYTYHRANFEQIDQFETPGELLEPIPIKPYQPPRFPTYQSKLRELD